MMTLVAPSILSANLLDLNNELRSVEEAGADWHHIDVMDGHYVPNLSFGLPLIKAIKKVAKIPLDVHLMVDNPDEVFEDYIEAGADILSFHAEVAKHPHRILQTLKSKQVKAGVALNPGSDLSHLEWLLEYVDVVLIMSVNPGFSGQKFIEKSYKKVRDVFTLIQKLHLEDQVRIQVDGGVNSQNIEGLTNNGASVVVSGSYIYSSDNRVSQIASLKKIKS